MSSADRLRGLSKVMTYRSTITRTAIRSCPRVSIEGASSWRRRLNGPDPGFAVPCVDVKSKVGPNQGLAWQDWSYRVVGGALNFDMGRQWPDAHRQIGGPLRAEPVSRGGPLANAI